MKLKVYVALVCIILVIIGIYYIYSKASKSREVLIYTSDSGIDAMLQKSAKIWTDRTNVEVTWVSPGGSGAVVQKAIQEKDQPQADIIIASVPSILVAKENEAIEKYVPPNAEHIPSVFKDADGYFTGWFAFYNCFVYNPDFVPEPPKTLQDLLDPAFKDKIIYPDPRTSGNGIRFVASLVAIMGENEAFQFLKELEKNVIGHPTLVQSSMIDRGEAWIAVHDSSVSLTDYFNESMTKQVMFFTEEGTIAGYVAIALTKGAPNANEAKEFLNFLLGEEAQIFVATEGYGMPTREGVELPENLKNVFQPVFDAKVLELDWTWMLEGMDHWKDRWTEEVIGG